MNPLIKDIEDELKRTRLDKTRLYSLLTKIVENCGGGSGGSGGAGPTGPAGPAGAQGPAGAKGPACECKCVAKEVATPAKVASPAPTPTKVAAPKKAPVKKKVAASA